MKKKKTIYEEWLKDKMVDLIDEYFPKGDNRRGHAIVMMSRYLMLFLGKEK